MDYEVQIVETLSRTVRINANSESEAYEKIKNQYMQSEIVLNSDDYVHTELVVKSIDTKEKDNA